MGVERWSDEGLVEVLRVIGGREPGVTMAEFCREVGVSWATIHRRFGGWSALRVRAGLPERGRRGGRIWYTEEVVLEAFRRAVAEVGPGLVQDEFCRRTGISPTVVAARFGSWEALRAREGLGPNRRGRPPTPADEIREALLRMVAERGNHRITLREFVERTGYSAGMVHRRCGGWERLRQELGLKENKPAKPRISDERLLADYDRVRAMLKREPTYPELDLYSFYGGETFRRRFLKMELRRQVTERVRERVAEIRADAERAAAEAEVRAAVGTGSALPARVPSASHRPGGRAAGAGECPAKGRRSRSRRARPRIPRNRVVRESVPGTDS